MFTNIVFAGTPYLSAHILSQILEAGYRPKAVYTRPDQPAGRGQRYQASPVKLVAQQHHLNIYQPNGFNDPAVHTELRCLEPDLMIVVGFGAIIPKTVLSIPANGCINIHVSLLPRWRGAAPIQRAIQSGDTETGITIMQMDAGLDTGPVLLQQSCPITEQETAVTLELKLQQLGADCVLKVISNWDYYQSKIQVQPESGIFYAHKINKEEANIDWSQPAVVIERQIRAFNLVPGAYTWLDNQRIKFFLARVVPDCSSKLPGTIIHHSDTELIISTGEQALSILELQLPGGKHLPCADVMHSKQAYFSVGKHFKRSAV
jgi:methionyl-tRNA formyltransferase